ncbi:MAG: hypothetical protein MUF07_12180 [Steroidobacteraceae bacterium]|nr:hypothetical protein [Steroidobacteraceae bacterium]
MSSARAAGGGEPPRELYETGKPARLGDPSRPAPAVDSGAADAGPTDGSDDYAGEFEQRSPGELGTGPAGEVRSREALLETVRRRIAEDPYVAHCEVRIGLGAQGLELDGRVPDEARRQRLRELVESAGAGRVTDRLQVGAPPAGAGRRRASPARS